jgi:molecular chaperone GrpE
VLFAGNNQPSSVRAVTEDNPKTATRPPPAEPHDSDLADAAADAPPQSAAAAQAETSRGDAPEPLQVLTAERDKLREQLLRTAADFDNYRKRSKRDVDEARQRGKDDLVRDLLPVFDNLERAVQTADTASDMRSVVDGVRMVLKLFEDTAERMGLSRVPSIGERFDPAVHEAIQQQETAAHPPGTIIAEVVPGYRFGQRLVRPAMVVVARKPSESKEGEAKSGGEAAAAAAPAGGSARPPAGASQRPPQGGAGGNGAAPKDSKDSE